MERLAKAAVAHTLVCAASRLVSTPDYRARHECRACTLKRAPQRRSGITVLEMLIVVTIVALMAGITLPSVNAGLDSIRMRSAADSVATFLAQAMTRVERVQEPVELTIHRGEGRLEMRSLTPGFARELALPDGVTVLRVHPEHPMEDNPARSVMLMPGGTYPALAIELLNRRGQRRMVRVDPLTGAPIVETPSESVSQEER